MKEFMEKRKNNILFGTGDNSMLPYDDEYDGHKEHVDNIKKDLYMLNRARNRALVSDFASGLVNLIARRKGSRVVLPTDSTEKYNKVLLQLNDKLHMAQRDYDGEIARKKVFTQQPKQTAVATPNQNSATNNSLPKVTLLKPISSFSIRHANSKNSINNSMKVVEQWRKEKMILPDWYSNKSNKKR